MLNVIAFALEEPFAGWWSGALRVVTFGMEFVVEVLPGRPGWKFTPAERPTLLEPFFTGDLLPFGSVGYCGETMAERASGLPIGMSPDVGVGSVL